MPEHLVRAAAVCIQRSPFHNCRIPARQPPHPIDPSRNPLLSTVHHGMPLRANVDSMYDAAPWQVPDEHVRVLIEPLSANAIPLSRLFTASSRSPFTHLDTTVEVVRFRTIQSTGRQSFPYKPSITDSVLSQQNLLKELRYYEAESEQSPANPSSSSMIAFLRCPACHRTAE